ncbi:MAG TPA: TetR/AcrR family transcriptional regulator, partial [Actinomycetes bacterium]|nr:TetR/AcrR family transcriptional regulator [Actinomycetes bacterium]
MDDQQPTGLPASIEVAWGVRTRPSKGPRPALSLERIVAAAVRVAATDGLQAVSMSRVAADLGVSTMSLYRYVGAKDELLALMADLTFEAPPAPRGPEESWRDGLARWAWTELAVYRRNPWVLRIPISGPPVTPNAIAWLERGLGCLRHTGLREDEKLSVILLLTGYVRNQGTLQADIAAAQAAGATPPDPAMMGSYGRLLARLTDPERFPALRAVIAAGVFDEPDES